MVQVEADLGGGGEPAEPEQVPEGQAIRCVEGWALEQTPDFHRIERTRPVELGAVLSPAPKESEPSILGDSVGIGELGGPTGKR